MITKEQIAKFEYTIGLKNAILQACELLNAGDYKGVSEILAPFMDKGEALSDAIASDSDNYPAESIIINQS